MKTYSFHAFEPTQNLDLAMRQLHLAARFRDELVALELRRRDEMWALMQGAPPMTKTEAGTTVEPAHRARYKKLYGATELHWGTKNAITDACGRSFDDVWAFVAKEETKEQLAARQRKWERRWQERKDEGSILPNAPLPPLPPRSCECKRPYQVGEAIWSSKGAHRIIGCPGCGPALRHKPFVGEGSLTVQVQKDRKGEYRTPATVTEAGPLNGEAKGQLYLTPHATTERDRKARLHGAREDRLTDLHMRIGQQPDGEAAWMTIPFYCHRALPPNAAIRWARVVRKRVATKYRWRVQIVLVGAPAPRASPSTGKIGIDVGWRLFPDRMRLAVWRDDAGNGGEVSAPKELLDKWAHKESLRSIRDRASLAMQDELVVERRVAVERKLWPDWLVGAAKNAHAWEGKRGEHMSSLCWRLAAELPKDLVALGKRKRQRETNKAWEERQAKLREGGAALQGELKVVFDLWARLNAWRRQDKHLYEWEIGEERKCLDTRRDIYRQFAAKVAGSYSEVRVEDLDLRDFAELPECGDKDPRTKNARPRRFKAGLSELIGGHVGGGALRDAVLSAGGTYVRVDPAWTTQRCHVCGQIEKFDAAGSVMHTCSHCGATWDQDVCAALNILRAPPDRVIVLECSQGGKLKESAVQKRRREGKERKRTKKVEGGE